MTDHDRYMQRCGQLADIAAQQGESSVGSIVVLDGRIIGEGYEQSKQLKDVTRHAEVAAILDAVSQHGHCKGATLYTNVEPCILCAYVVRHHRIATVVYTKPCGELGGTNPQFSILTTTQISAWGNPPDVIIHPDTITPQ